MAGAENTTENACGVWTPLDFNRYLAVEKQQICKLIARHRVPCYELVGLLFLRDVCTFVILIFASGGRSLKQHFFRWGAAAKIHIFVALEVKKVELC